MSCDIFSRAAPSHAAPEGGAGRHGVIINCIIAGLTFRAPRELIAPLEGFAPFRDGDGDGDGEDNNGENGGGEPTSETPRSEVAAAKFALWVAFAMLALRHQTIPIHASAIVHRGRAVLFLGESGTGKSTHTRLWVEHIADSRVLNDDSPVVRVAEDGSVAAHGSPWSGKTDFHIALQAPLAAMVRLRQGAENRIEKLSGLRALGAVWPSCPPMLASDSAFAPTMLAVVGRVVEAVPIYEMECLPNPEAAKIACNKIFDCE